jgi:hypothetical protein
MKAKRKNAGLLRLELRIALTRHAGYSLLKIVIMDCHELLPLNLQVPWG